MAYHMTPRERVGIAALMAIVAALGGMVASCAGHPFWGLLLGIAAIPLGLVGWLRSISPEVRGGVMSIAAVAFGVLGVGFALIVLVFKIALWPFS